MTEAHGDDANLAIDVGAVQIGGGQSDYWSHFSVQELSPDWVATTTGKGVNRMKACLPANGQFVVPLIPVIAQSGFQGNAAEDAWSRTCGIAEKLGARRFLVRTPSSFRPTPDNEKRMIDFFTPERVKSRSIYWWAEGLWESQPDIVTRICDATGLVLVLDPLAMEPDDLLPLTPNFYWRIVGGRGMRRGLNDFELEKLVDDALERRQGTIVFAGPAVAGDAKRFVRLLKMELELDESQD